MKKFTVKDFGISTVIAIGTYVGSKVVKKVADYVTENVVDYAAIQAEEQRKADLAQTKKDVFEEISNVAEQKIDCVEDAVEVLAKAVVMANDDMSDDALSEAYSVLVHKGYLAHKATTAEEFVKAMNNLNGFADELVVGNNTSRYKAAYVAQTYERCNRSIEFEYAKKLAKINNDAAMERTKATNDCIFKAVGNVCKTATNITDKIKPEEKNAGTFEQIYDGVASGIKKSSAKDIERINNVLNDEELMNNYTAFVKQAMNEKYNNKEEK